MKSIDILMESGFREMVEDLQGLIDAGRIRAPDAEALGHLLNGATINLAFWAAEGTTAKDRRARAHATLAALFDGMTVAGAQGNPPRATSSSRRKRPSEE